MALHISDVPQPGRLLQQPYNASIGFTFPGEQKTNLSDVFI